MFKYIWKKFKKELILLLILLIGITALLSRLNQFGLSIIVGAVLMYLYTKYRQDNPDEIKNLKQTLKNQQQEIEELKNRKLNVVGLKNILEVGLMEIDTNFTRTWNEKFTEDQKDLHFIGALQIQLKAKYGVNLKDLKVKIDHEQKTIYIANLQPKFLSFSEINHDWKIAEMMEHKKRPWIISNYWKKSEKYQELLNRKMEEKRKALYEEVKQGPEEIQWLIKPLYQQVENTMRILLNRSDYEIEFIKPSTEKDYLPIDSYFNDPVIHKQIEK
jgi:Skp family chaperone for outer membrane proteins